MTVQSYVNRHRQFGQYISADHASRNNVKSCCFDAHFVSTLICILFHLPQPTIAVACVASWINGGGKTDHIMSKVARRQAAEPNLLYHRIPIREATTADSLVAALSAATSADEASANGVDASHAEHAFHLDVAHIIPESANVCLFELLIVGVLKATSLSSSASGQTHRHRVYHRRAADAFFVEIPNSLGERTRTALRTCLLFRSTELLVARDTFSFERPVFVTDAPQVMRRVDEDGKKSR